MSINAKIVFGPVTIEIAAEGIIELWEKMGSVCDIIDEQCGRCKSTRLFPRVRKPKNKAGKAVTYCELNCRDCGASLSLGIHQDKSGLFPKRKLDKDGRPSLEGTYDKQYGGWVKWTPAFDDGLDDDAPRAEPRQGDPERPANTRERPERPSRPVRPNRPEF